EQADGRTATAASDIYSLGVVAFQCLAGRVPFDAGSDVGVALAHLRDPVPALPTNVLAPLASLVTRMLAKAPDDRPSATEVAEQLERLTADADTAGVTVPIPRFRREVDRAATAVMPLVLAARHRLRDRLAGRDLRETRSAPLRARLLLVPVAAAVLLTIALAFGGGSGGLQPSAAAGPATHSAQSHVADSYVTVNPTRYRGKPWTTVRAELRALGLHPTPQFVAIGATGTVLALAPTGQVDKGSSITVVVSRTAPPKHPAPAKRAAPAKHAAKPKDNHGPGPGGHGPAGPPGHSKKGHDG
ncbi:MAG TPA: hypothetical protein VHV76_13960, partial [Mycobacteriales bacterium]|nr:hypothetical protein [Mycobacteriales bacterium]